MAKLDRIANVQIALRTTAITEMSFSDMLIFGPHVLSPNRVMVITEAGELLDMGMSPDDPIYRAASAAFGQIPSVRQVFIGRSQVDSVAVTVTSAVETSEYKIVIQWRDETGTVQTENAVYVAEAGDDAAAIATGLAAAVGDAAAPVTATATTGTVTVVNDVNGAALGVTLAGNLTLGTLTGSEPIAAGLAAINAESGNWYGLVITSREAADVLAAADWAEANLKLFGTTSADPGVIDAAVTTDIASVANQRQYFRTFVGYSSKAATEYREAAMMSNAFTYYPGQEQWSLKRLSGVTYDGLQEGQFIAADAKNVSTFELFRNFAVTQGGKVAAGEWIDVIRLRDALVDQIKVSVVYAMVNADGKVPYTDDGIQVIGNAIRGPLELNVRRGGIAPPELNEQNKVIPSYTLSLPRSYLIPSNDKAARILRDVKFTARLAGAIRVVEIKGSLSYAL